jgi:hypothetical protein
MVWGMIGSTGGIAFCKVEENLTSEVYVNKILKK